MASRKHNYDQQSKAFIIYFYTVGSSPYCERPERLGQGRLSDELSLKLVLKGEWLPEGTPWRQTRRAGVSMHAIGEKGEPLAQDSRGRAPSSVSVLASSLSLVPFCMLAHQLAQGRTEKGTPHPREGLQSSRWMPQKPRTTPTCDWADDSDAQQGLPFLDNYVHIHNCDSGQLRFRVSPKLQSHHYPGATIHLRCHLGFEAGLQGSPSHPGYALCSF